MLSKFKVLLWCVQMIVTLFLPRLCRWVETIFKSISNHGLETFSHKKNVWNWRWQKFAHINTAKLNYILMLDICAWLITKESLTHAIILKLKKVWLTSWIYYRLEPFHDTSELSKDMRDKNIDWSSQTLDKS